MGPPEIELFYFDTAGRAECLRLAMAAAGLKFIDTRLTKEEFSKRKKEFPCGVLPAMKINGRIFGQTYALLKWIGKQNSSRLFPDDPIKALIVEEALGVVDDAMNKMKFGLPDNELKISREEFVAGPLKTCLEFLETAIEMNGGKYIAGEEMTVVDIFILTIITWLCSGVLDYFPVNIIDTYPKLKACKEATAAHSAIVKYYKERSKKGP
eukprot:Filipodium_phascolosomae@DN1470_c1_g1_i1.p1